MVWSGGRPGWHGLFGRGGRGGGRGGGWVGKGRGSGGWAGGGEGAEDQRNGNRGSINQPNSFHNLPDLLLEMLGWYGRDLPARLSVARRLHLSVWVP